MKRIIYILAALVIAACIKGYEQAEKDLALTWEDIAKIDDMLREVENCVATSDLPTMGREEYYTEVLNRYNELKRNESKN